MHILTISDIHGRDAWKQVDVAAYDKVIFLGDFTDSHTLGDAVIWTNLLAIVELKKTHPDRVVLLIGNHDAQYMHYPHYRCSGYRRLMQPALTKLFTEEQALFSLAWQHGGYLPTHAGLSNEWLARFLKKMGKPKPTITTEYDLAGLLNRAHRAGSSQRDALFDVGYSRGGTERLGGPVWADQSETISNYLTGFHQIVGHTPVPEFQTTGDSVSSITYTDVLGTRDAFYEVVIPD